MKTLFSATLLLLLLTAVLGCATRQSYTLDESIPEQQLAQLYIYRSNIAFHSVNIEKPFIYIDNKLATQLAPGEFTLVKVPAGLHRFSVRESIAFIPGKEADDFNQTLEAGKTYYLRYSLDFSGAMASGSMVTNKGVSSLRLVDSRSFEQRQ